MVATSRLPPQNLEAEQSVLGGILIDNQVFHKVIDILAAEDFYRPANGKIFAAMVDLAAKGEPIDVVTLPAKLREMSTLEEIGGAAYLAELLERVPTAINAEYHAGLVVEQAMKRRLVSACNEIGDKAMDPTEKTDELLDHAEKTIFSLTSSKKTKAVSPIRDIVREAFVQLEYRYAHQGEMTGCPTGFIDLDKLTMGFQPADLVIVACRPSMGKTSFALGVTRGAACASNKAVVFFSLEMSKEQLVTRLLASEGRVDSQNLRTGRLGDSDWGKLTQAAGRLADAKIFIDDTPSLTVLEMRAKARRIKAEVGEVGIIIVDYLQIMGTPKGAESRERAISEISRSLKALAKELGAPVLALSQLNRGVEQRQDKRPLMSDLRESGAIEQDADIIIFIHRDNPEAMMHGSEPSMAEFIIGKNRNGPRETVKVVWMGKYTSFENLTTVPVGA